MEHESSLHQRVGLYLLYETWHAFRIACVTRKLSASKEIDRLIRQQLAAWQRDTEKETTHG
jgi:hypothetical protein